MSNLREFGYTSKLSELNILGYNIALIGLNLRNLVSLTLGESEFSNPEGLTLALYLK